MVATWNLVSPVHFALIWEIRLRESAEFHIINKPLGQLQNLLPQLLVSKKTNTYLEPWDTGGSDSSFAPRMLAVVLVSVLLGTSWGWV